MFSAIAPFGWVSTLAGAFGAVPLVLFFFFLDDSLVSPSMILTHGVFARTYDRGFSNSGVRLGWFDNVLACSHKLRQPALAANQIFNMSITLHLYGAMSQAEALSCHPVDWKTQ